MAWSPAQGGPLSQLSPQDGFAADCRRAAVEPALSAHGGTLRAIRRVPESKVARQWGWEEQFETGKVLKRDSGSP